MKKYLAEMIGTMVLVLMGCGTAVSLGCNPVGADLSTVVGTAMASVFQLLQWHILLAEFQVVTSIQQSH